MNLWKILGGAVIGVGAVAAAPFTGGGSVLGAATLLGSLAGAGTAAAAVAAAATGAAVGAAMSENEEEEKKKIYNDGHNEGIKKERSESAIKIEKLQNRIKSIHKNTKDTKKHFDTIIAMNALGFSCANCDGNISKSEIDTIQMFISGASTQSLPAQVQDTINRMAASPPNIKEAFHLAKKADVDMSIFDEMVALVVYADGHVHEAERAFMHAWGKLRAA